MTRVAGPDGGGLGGKGKRLFRGGGGEGLGEGRGGGGGGEGGAVNGSVNGWSAVEANEEPSAIVAPVKFVIPGLEIFTGSRSNL